MHLNFKHNVFFLVDLFKFQPINNPSFIISLWEKYEP